MQAIQPVPDLPKEKYVPPDWNDAVANGVRIIANSFTDIKPGKHTLKIWMMTPGVIFEKFVCSIWSIMLDMLLIGPLSRL